MLFFKYHQKHDVIGKKKNPKVVKVGSVLKLYYSVVIVVVILLTRPNSSDGFVQLSSSSSSSIVDKPRTKITTTFHENHLVRSRFSVCSMKYHDTSDMDIMNNDNNKNSNGWEVCCRRRWRSCVMAAGIMCWMMGGNGVEVSWAGGSDYGSMAVENRAVAEAWRIVDNNYLERTFNGQDWFGMRQKLVTKTKYKTMDEANAAIDKMVSSLGDKYTRYLPPAKYTSIVNAATGTLAGGVGVELSLDAKTNLVYASDVQPNSPAEQAGITPGDVFLIVDGLAVDDGKATPDDVAARLRGPEGSRVGLTVSRNNNNEDYILTRQPITVASVKSYISPSNKKVGVIKIKVFSGTTAQTVKESLLTLKKQGATSIVLDLRNNVGGLLPGGVETASLFLDKDLPVVFVVDKKGVVDSQSTFQEGLDTTDPLVLVVNDNTASAAEVLTAALLENNRAVAVGTQTFGKGIVQTIRQLSFDNGGVAVTVARYETPLHNDINKQGIPVSTPLSNNNDNKCETQNKNDIVVCIPNNAFQSPPIQPK